MNRNAKRWTQLNLCALILACTACGYNETQQPDEADSTDNRPNTMNKRELRAGSDANIMDQQISEAVADLAARTGVAADAITVKEARSVQWGSGALGCPEPGKSYTQAMVPGIRLLLEADGSIYYYHGRSRGSLFNCPAERVRAPAYGPGQEII